MEIDFKDKPFKYSFDSQKELLDYYNHCFYCKSKMMCANYNINCKNKCDCFYVSLPANENESNNVCWINIYAHKVSSSCLLVCRNNYVQYFNYSAGKPPSMPIEIKLSYQTFNKAYNILQTLINF
jgi:hypothetical protein